MMCGIAIVLGSGTSGSAIACGLHADGLDVVIIDRADPPCPYRGMAFTDAWFLGTSQLDALSACFCASVRSIPTVLQRRMIAATTRSWRGVAEALGADVLVDTRRSDARSALRACFPLTRTEGAGDPSGADHADLITGLTTRFPRRTVVAADTARPVLAPSPAVILFAQRPGRLATRGHVGDSVAAGDEVACVGLDQVVAPSAGLIRGLPARGARVSSGDIVLHIDPAGERARCFGIESCARAFAEKVVREVRDCGRPLSSVAASRVDHALAHG